MITFARENNIHFYKNNDDETDETMVDACRRGCAVRHDDGLQGGCHLRHYCGAHSIDGGLLFIAQQGNIFLIPIVSAVHTDFWEELCECSAFQSLRLLRRTRQQKR